jgi:hypothetical protein
MAAVAWPTTAQLKQRLDVTSDDWDDQLDRVLASAIAETKRRVGDWDDDFSQPDEAVSQSALELAVEYGMSGEGVSSQKSKSRALLFGKRRRFGIG